MALHTHGGFSLLQGFLFPRRGWIALPQPLKRRDAWHKTARGVHEIPSQTRVWTRDGGLVDFCQLLGFQTCICKKQRRVRCSIIQKLCETRARTCG